MRIFRLMAAPLLAALVAGCVSVDSVPPGGPAESTNPPPPSSISTPTTAPEPVSTVVGGQPGAAQGVCGLFSPDEIAAYVGEPMDSGLFNEQIGTCVWSALQGDSYVLMQQVPADYYEEHSLDPNFHKVSGIGEEASITNALIGGGLALTVRSGDSAYFVDLVPAADDQAVIALALEFIARSGGS